MVRASRRPWAATHPIGDASPGILWHAEFMMRDRTVETARLWRDAYMNAVRPLLVHLVAEDPHHVGFTFSGADAGAGIADAIGQAFDAVLSVSRPIGSLDLDYAAWEKRSRRIDYRVVSGANWSIVDETTLPITFFGAGTGVRQLPEW